MQDFWVAPAFRGKLIKISWGVAIIGVSLLLMAAGYLCMFTSDLSLFDEGKQKASPTPILKPHAATLFDRYQPCAMHMSTP